MRQEKPTVKSQQRCLGNPGGFPCIFRHGLGAGWVNPGFPVGFASTDGARGVMRCTGTTTTGDDASPSLASPVAPLLAGIPSRALLLLYASAAVGTARRH